MEKHKIVIPICGIERSMVGISINGWKIICISDEDEKDDTFDFAGIHGNECIPKIIKYFQLYGFLEKINFISNGSINFEQKDPEFYFIALAKETDPTTKNFKWECIATIEAMRFYKSSQIGFGAPMEITEQGLQQMDIFADYNYVLVESSIPRFALSEVDKKSFFTFAERLLSVADYPEIVSRMAPFFHESCIIKNRSVRFVLRITIMEMLIEGNQELSYRLRHHMAVLLGRSLEESKEIDSNMKKMYTARSKYLHDGAISKNSDEYCTLSFEYARRLIANLCMITDSIQEIRAKLDVAGYGANPYQVQF